MKITGSFARLLQELILGKELNRSDFQGVSRRLLERFLTDGVLDDRTAEGGGKKIFCRNAINLKNYLHHHYEIPDLEVYLNYWQLENPSRRDAVVAGSDSKIRKVKVMEGFLVNTFENITATLGSRELKILPTPGSFIFIHDYMNFRLPSDVTIVVVEGHENFRYVERQRHLFAAIRPVFLWRYQNSNSIAAWLGSISNRYLHYGDFDPKGIHIYISEFRSRLPEERCGFFIPDNIEWLVAEHGEKKLYEQQMERLGGVEFEKYPEIRFLMDILRKYKKGLAQEVLISSV